MYNNVDSFQKCSHFIDQFNNIRNMFGHIQTDKFNELIIVDSVFSYFYMAI